MRMSKIGLNIENEKKQRRTTENWMEKMIFYPAAKSFWYLPTSLRIDREEELRFNLIVFGECLYCW